ncbi:MAG TPA: hypothetical protein VGC92_09700 [Phenylobacterium sp.]
MPLGLASALALSLVSAFAARSVAQVAAPRPVLSSNLDQIQNQYAADAAAARAKFQKVAVQFTAVADQVTAPSGQDLVIAFHTRQHPQPVRAVFLKRGADAHGPVKPGDLVMARCDKVAEVAGKPELHDCVFR